MNITTEQLADLVIGIARAQNAVIEAIDRANPGFRNTHAAPILNVAANIRAGDPRMIDLPSRVLLRLQGRVALDNAAVKADLERLMSGGPAAAPVAFAAPKPAAARAAPKPAAAPEAGADGLDFSVKP
jgi:hypothetical protein